MKTWADYEHARRPLGEYLATPYLTAPSILAALDAIRRDKDDGLLEPRKVKRVHVPYVCGGSIMDGIRRSGDTWRPTAAQRAWARRFGPGRKITATQLTLPIVTTVTDGQYHGVVA